MDGKTRREALALLPAVLLAGKAGRMGLEATAGSKMSQFLRLAFFRSPNYVAGVSGWTINQDGSAEFNNGTFRGHIVGGDLFIYNGVPGLGNPPIFWSTSAAADPFGNPITSTSGLQGAGTFVVGNLKLTAAGITFAVANPLNVNGLRIGLSSPGSLVELNAATPILVDGATLFDQPIGTVKPGTTDTLETWHAMTLLNSWANVATFATCRYRLTPLNQVEILGTLNAAAATATTFFTLPAAYQPASQQPVCSAGANASVPAGLAPWIRCDASGNLTVQNTGGIPAAFQLFFHGFISLDA